MLNAAQVTVLLDSVASGKLLFDATMGTTGAEANTVSKTAQNDVATIRAIPDIDVQADLAMAYRARAQALVAGSLYVTLGSYNLWWALNEHLGGLDAFLAQNNVRVSEACVAMGFPLSQAQILPPVVDPMATYAVSSPGAGTYTHVANVDSSKYGRAWLDVVATSTIGAADLAVTVNGLQFDQSTPVSRTVTLPAGSPPGTAVHVGTLPVQEDNLNSVSSITIVGGTAGDMFKVVSRLERAINPVS